MQQAATDKTVEIQVADPSDLESQQVRLQVISGPHEGLSWVFVTPVNVVIGRDDRCHVRLANESLFSRRHCELRLQGSDIHLLDLGSTNGLEVNGIKIVEGSLQNGDIFGIGDTRLRVEFISRPSTSSSDALVPSTSDFIPINELPKAKVDDDNDSIEWPETHAFPSEAITTKTTAHTSTERIALSDVTVQTCGAWSLGALIGEGGMSSVFFATHRRSGAKAALKVIRTVESQHEKMQQLFTREATILFRLNHPRIVKILDYGLERRNLFLAMEYLPCIDLLPLLKKMSPERHIKTSCWVIARILEALAFTHEQGIVHRDVKPSNILAFRQSGRLHVKLADFGLAKYFDNAGFSGITDERSLRGTLAFMSPEQLKQSRNVGPAADIYSAGACLYRFLAGKNLVLANDQATFDEAGLQSLSIPAPLIQIVKKATAATETARFQNAMEMASCLQPYYSR